MKNNYLIVSLIVLISAFSSNAQVVNGNFENIKPNLLPSNWGMNFLQQFTIDPVTGQSSTNNDILFTWCIPSMCYVSYEPFSGQYAMEVSNAYNTTLEEVIPGQAIIFSDSTLDIPGWNPGIPVSPGANIFTLGFYYKFFPAGNDVAEAKITVFDDQGSTIGETDITISGLHSQYQYVYSYIDYTSNAQPASMNISFNMAKEGSTPTFGTRLVIDNVVTNFQALSLIENPIANNTEFKVYPTLVDSEISVVPATDAVGNINYKIFNTEGRLVKETNAENSNAYVYPMNLSELTSGIYFLQIDSNLGKTTKKLIKR